MKVPRILSSCLMMAGLLGWMFFCTGCETKAPSTDGTSTSSSPGQTTSTDGQTASIGTLSQTGTNTDSATTDLDGEKVTAGTSTGDSTSSTGTTTSASTADSSAVEAELNAWGGGKLSPEKFIALLGPAARADAQRTGVPASVTLAQAALETGWGRATMGSGKNLFGIKGVGPAGSVTSGTMEEANGQKYSTSAKFRKYNTWSESIADHSRLISQNSRYKNCMANKNDPKQFARELQKAGYATDSTYASQLISIMNSHNLYQYDS